MARSAGADYMKLLQVTMGHASIVVTAHTYADLYDSDLDRVADALDGLAGAAVVDSGGQPKRVVGDGSNPTGKRR